MDLQLKNQRFIVCGATSGLGLAIAKALLTEGASIIAIARNEQKLSELSTFYPSQIEIFAGDITAAGEVQRLTAQVGNRTVHGMLVNAGGPPAKTVSETTLEDWDTAYHTLLRWKVDIAKTFVPKMAQSGYGRVLFIESSSVKQPLENLILSNSLRLAAVGFVKTYALEVAASGITINILGPGSHNTPAIERMYKKKSEQSGQSIEASRAAVAQQIPMGVLGEPADFASLAAWLFSPHSRYITGQTISVDGGLVRSTFG